MSARICILLTLIAIADKFNPNWSLLSNILHILELIIEQGQIDNGNVSLNETEDYSDFLKWSSRNDQKYSFDKLTREEKVERIFLVLNLLLQLMESDLVMWSIAYGDNPAKKMAEQRKYSLIAHFLWPDGPAGEVNQRVKSILNMFVQYVSIDFAPHKIGYLAVRLRALRHTRGIYLTDMILYFQRLINLIYHAVYLTEVKGEHMQYPIMPRRCQILCDTLNKAIESTYRRNGLQLFVHFSTEQNALRNLYKHHNDIAFTIDHLFVCSQPSIRHHFVSQCPETFANSRPEVAVVHQVPE